MSTDLTALLHADLHTQAAALAAGRCTSLALTQATLDAIAQRNPQLNAWLHVDTPGALAAAAASDLRRASGQCIGMLDGLTLGVKDNIDVAGTPTTAGMATRRGCVAAEDAFVVAQLRAAGMVLLGKLHMHEAALGATNANLHFGDCQHPTHPGHTPGGSSGGSACAVAAGLCALALGSDTMGSIRLPASYCGVVGFKPSHGRVSTRGSVACCWALDHIGPLVRSRLDVRLVMGVMGRFDALCADARPYASFGAFADPVQLITSSDLAQLGVEAQVIASFEGAIATLQARAHAITRIPLAGYPFARARRAGLLCAEADLLVEHGPDWQTQPQNFSPALTAAMRFAEGQSAAALARAQRTVAQARVEVARWWQHGQLMLLPTTPQTAFPHTAPVPANQADLTSIANMAGVPALSVPLPVPPGTLPIGLQLIGPLGSDDVLLPTAEQLLESIAAA